MKRHRPRSLKILAIVVGALLLVPLPFLAFPTRPSSSGASRLPPSEHRVLSPSPSTRIDGTGLFAPAHGPSLERGRPAIGSDYWSNITGLGAAIPGTTFGGAMAFDPASNTTVFLGGDSAGVTGLAWSYRNFTWSSSFPGVPEIFPALAYDGSGADLIAFGGGAPIPSEPGSTVPTNATYGFSGGVWANLTPALSASPPAGAQPLMASDPADGYAVLLDPVGSPNSSQTWTYENGSWTNLTGTAGTPPPGPTGADSVMAYDPAVGAVIFFGGSVPGPGYALATNETWEFRAGQWTNLNISGPDFNTGATQTLAFDGGSNAMVDLVAPAYLYSENGSPSYEDWQFLAGAWSNRTPYLPTTPPIGFDPLSEWDAADGYVLYEVGGIGSQSWALGSTPLRAGLAVESSPVDIGNSLTLSTVVTGGAPPLRYTYSGLPPGCTSASLPTLVCLPTGTGNFTVRVSVEDFTNVTANVTAGVQVEARLVASGPLVSTHIAYVGEVVVYSVTVSGGLPPYAFAWNVPSTNCTAPDVPTFNCTANVVGTFPVSVNVTDSTATGSANDSGDLTVVAIPAILSFVASPNPVEVGQPLEFNASLVGGALPLLYNFSGLPTGCLARSVPNWNCAPTGPGSYNVTVSVTDALGTVVRATAEITVVAPLAIAELGISPNPAPAGSVVIFSYTVAGGEAPIHSAWTDLPPGCIASQTAFDCVMNTTGSFDVGLTLRDALGGVARSNLTLIVAAPGGTSETPSGFELVPLWAWAALGLAGIAAIFLVVRGRERWHRSDPGDPHVEGEGSEPGANPPDSGPVERF
ncbi:MAG: hypothetical protein L3K02_02285 [Thermoplasmata archaeon]|nr:hypothetical protein [Thermoplasmata archaeon]